MKRNVGWLMELLIGRWRPSLAVARLGLGVVCPGVLLAYALRSLAVRQVIVLSRGGCPPRVGLHEVNGLPAVAVGVAYACVALIIYVHVCWEDHPYLAGVRDVARQYLLLAILIALAATFGLALL